MSSNNELKMKLGKKISHAAKVFGKVDVDGKNTFSNYSYISSNKMVAILRDGLDTLGLSIIPEISEYKEDHFKSDKGKQTTRTTVSMNFEIIDTETGYSVVKKWFGSDQDTGGKSFGQAITECTKRFYFKLFQVSSHDEIDPDSKSTEHQGSAQVQKPDAIIKDLGEWKPYLQSDEVHNISSAINAKNWKQVIEYHDKLAPLIDERARKAV